MKYLVAPFALCSLLLLGAGCGGGKYVQIKEPSPVPVESNVVTTTNSGMLIGNTFSNEGNVYVHQGGVSFSFVYKGKVGNTQSAVNSDALGVLDLGTMAEITGAQAVPERSLEVLLVSATDTRMKNCAFSDAGWPVGYQPTVKKQMLGAHTFCVTDEMDAAAGNRYAKRSYALTTEGRTIVLQFIIHSVVCENYDRPMEQCVPYDETRDTKGFDDIAESLKTGL